MINTRIFRVKCRKCGNYMKYSTTAKNTELNKKTKRCVYCGFSNNVGRLLDIKA